MAGLNVVSFRPERSDYAWTFGGVEPVMKVKPGDVLEVWTEDCFAGLVQTVDDLPSEKITAFNPQTGPFYVEGAEPGDTLALHFVSIEPSRDWAISTTFPLFGALTSTLRTVTLQDPLDEIVWRYDVDRTDAARPLRGPQRRLRDGPAARSDARDRRRRARRRRGPVLAGPRRPRRQHGHARDARRHHVLPRRERRGRALLARRRPLPPGRGRDVRRRRRGGDGHRPGRRAHQGPAHARGPGWRPTTTSSRRARRGRSKTRSGSRTGTW